MTREFKFRAWHKVKKKMYTIYGRNQNGYWQYSPFETDPDSDEIVITSMAKYANLEELEVMQYTGLKDDCGCEIYEGDLVKVTYRHREPEIFEVTYDWCGFYPFVGFIIEDVMPLTLVVEGNVYENKTEKV